MSVFLRKYGTLTVTGTTAIRIPMIKRAVVDFAIGADWTPASGDVKIAIDGAAAANVTNLPTAVAMGNAAYWEFILTAAELTSKSSVVTIADSATKAVEDNAFIVETFGNASAMYQADLSAANLPANMVQIAGASVSTSTAQLGVNLVNIAGSAVSTSTAQLGVNVVTNGDKTGYSLSQSFPSNFASLAITAGGAVTVGTNSDKTGYTVTTVSDKTGYSLSQSFPSNFASMGITAGGAVMIDGTSVMTEAYSTKAGTLTVAQALHELVQFTDYRAIASTTVTIKKRDGSTTAKTLTLDSATVPTSTVRAT